MLKWRLGESRKTKPKAKEVVEAIVVRKEPITLVARVYNISPERYLSAWPAIVKATTGRQGRPKKVTADDLKWLYDARSQRNIHIPVTDNTPFLSVRGDDSSGINWILGRFIGCLSNYVSNWAGSIAVPIMVRAFTTCAIRLSFAAYCYGRHKAWMSTDRCWLYPLMSGMPWSPILTGI